MVDNLLIATEKDYSIKIRDMVESLNYKVINVTSNGQEAINLIRKNVPDLLILDTSLEGDVDGLEVASSIKDLKIPVIFITSHTDDTITQKALKTEPYGYLVKPFQAVELKFAVEMALYKKKMEGEIRWSEDRLKIGMDIGKMVYWEYDTESDIFTFDEQFYALYGTSAQEEGGNMLTSAEYTSRFVPPEEQEAVGVEVVKALETDDPNFASSMQHWIVRADGERRYIIVRIRIRTDENGNKIGTRGVNQDITEIKMAEMALMEADQRLADIIDFLPDATFSIDGKGMVISWNRAIEEMTRVWSESILGKENYEYSLLFYGERRPMLIDLVNGKDDQIRKYYPDFIRDGKVLIAETELNIRGDIITAWVKAVPFEDSKGNFIGAIEAIRDITEMKESRRKIQKELEINKSLANIYVPLVSPLSSIEDVARAILEESQKLTGSLCGFVSVKDPATDVLRKLAIMTADLHDKVTVSKLTVSQEGSNSDFLNNKDFIFNEFPISQVEEYLKEKFKPDKYLYLPVLLGEEMVGEITLINPVDKYTDDDYKAIERLAVFYSLAIQNKQAEQEIKQSLKDKEILLKEIHHRVKNNLMVISSLLELQSSYIKDTAALEVFKESQNRAKAMAFIHERLYRSTDLKRINFGEYIHTLGRDLFNLYVLDPTRITLNLDVKDIMVDISTAVPLGLIINELLTNSLKYAFPEDRCGTINLGFSQNSGEYELKISDDGIGMPEGLDFKNTDSLGLQLVNSLIQQIDGEITLDHNQGTEFTITFKEQY